MAKSIRSKWRRKCRAIKRERYGAKELARLKKTLGIDENTATMDTETSEISQIATITTADDIRANNASKDKEADKEDGSVEKMEEDNGKVFSKKTLRDQNGHYPVWMSRRKIVKNKKGRQKSKKASAKQTKRLTRKQKKKIQCSA